MPNILNNATNGTIINWEMYQIKFEPQHEKTCPQFARSSASEANQGLQMNIKYLDIRRPRQRITRTLIRLRGRAGWFASFLFAYDINRFCHASAHLTVSGHTNVDIWMNSENELNLFQTGKENVD